MGALLGCLVGLQLQQLQGMQVHVLQNMGEHVMMIDTGLHSWRLHLRGDSRHHPPYASGQLAEPS